jgi:hypothetical protein
MKVRPLREPLILTVQQLDTFFKLVRAVSVESLVVKHQLLIRNRAGRRALNPSSSDRFALGLTELFVSPAPDCKT